MYLKSADGLGNCVMYLKSADGLANCVMYLKSADGLANCVDPDMGLCCLLRPTCQSA